MTCKPAANAQAFKPWANDNFGIWRKHGNIYASDGRMTYRFNDCAGLQEFIQQEHAEWFKIYGPLPETRMGWRVYDKGGRHICDTSRFSYWTERGYTLKPILKIK